MQLGRGDSGTHSSGAHGKGVEVPGLPPCAFERAAAWQSRPDVSSTLRRPAAARPQRLSLSSRHPLLPYQLQLPPAPPLPPAALQAAGQIDLWDATRLAGMAVCRWLDPGLAPHHRVRLAAAHSVRRILTAPPCCRRHHHHPSLLPHLRTQPLNQAPFDQDDFTKMYLSRAWLISTTSICLAWAAGRRRMPGPALPADPPAPFSKNSHYKRQGCD